MGREICRSAVLVIILVCLVFAKPWFNEWAEWGSLPVFSFQRWKIDDLFSRKPRCKHLIWACYPLSSKYQLGFKGLPGPLTSIPWLLHSMLLYGTSSGTIIRWSCKGFTVHVWVATLIWLMMSLALSGAFSLYGFCHGVLACKTCEVRPWAYCEVMTALAWVTWSVPEIMTALGVGRIESLTFSLLGHLAFQRFVCLETEGSGTSSLGWISVS